MALMRASTMIGILALLAGASCFWGEPNAPLTSETFVGTYIYYSVNSETLHGPDELTLRGDGTYSLILKPSGVLPTEEGQWQLVLDSYGPEIRLDRVGYWVWIRGSGTKEEEWLVVDSFGPDFRPARAGYHVWIKGRNIRLEIDDELGEWYQKIE